MDTAPDRRSSPGVGVAGVSVTLLAAYVLFNLMGGGSPLAIAVHVAALVVIVASAATWLRQRSIPATSTGDSDGLLPTVRRLASAIDAADPFTRGRAYRVSRYAVRIAERLGLSPRDVQDVEFAALLHNIGRIAIHRDVLLKRGHLTADERQEIQSHPQVAHRILRDIPPLARPAELVLAHHEHPDGTGYPKGLQGEDIPIGSQVVLVASAFDAMTSDRPYRPGLTPTRAFEELRDGVGKQFSGKIVDCLIELYESHALFEGFDHEELRLYGDEDPVVLGMIDDADGSPGNGSASRAA